MPSRRVLVAGATGFVGSELYPALESAGHEVLGTSRDPEQAEAEFPFRTFVELDTQDPDLTRRALEGVDVAYYLVHGMSGGDEDYEHAERRSAEVFLRASEEAGVERIVYLGGIRPSGEPSKHLRSRLRTGEILRSGRPSTIELRAAMIVGYGGASWQIVRDCATRLPAMLLPRWSASRSEPVWLGDVVTALVEAAVDPLAGSGIFDLPGPEVLSSRQILARVASLQGSEPFMMEVPFVTPKLSSLWLALVTRTDRRLCAELVEGLRSDILSVPDRRYWSRIEHEPLGFEVAARRALLGDDEGLPWSTLAAEWAVRQASAVKPENP